MYTTNLPDDVMIPDMLLVHVERGLQIGVLSKQAKDDAEAWVRLNKAAEQDIRDFWVRHIRGNISSCKKYGVPECVEFFGYVYQLIESLW